ncbi:tyrosine-type recombinase/integrase [Geochorda subterranea]|uniref:Tyrosine-type recombinase/integrase n=1 Tax=Geochorda subterranea TaxID=3109564 RepID=A0ABZ1BPE4_9FIRM|nr:tyrosine-type recombinase/integrase [Limnochorda sp. LNt]WRP14599.1 tyrosine-type recombinase/integrase [Limnochorda sp. LNt]
MGISRTKDGRFRVVVFMGRDPATGKKLFHDTICDTEREAKAKEKEWEQEKAQKRFVAPSERLTVKEFLELWLKNDAPNTTKPRTLKRYKELVNLHITPRLGAVRLDLLSPQHVKRLLAEKREEGLSARTCLHIYRVLHRALNSALEDGRISQNVCDRVRPPKVDEKLPDGLSTEQVDALLRAARYIEGERLPDGTRVQIPNPLYPLYLTAVHTGMRLGELLGLRWADVDLDVGVAVVQQALVKAGRQPVFDTPKNRKPRVVPLSPEVIEALRQLRIDQEIARANYSQRGKQYGAFPGHEEHGPLVFCQENGWPLEPGNLTQRNFKELLKKAGLPRDIRFHDLRHTFVSRALQAGANPRAVSEIVGHYDPGFTLKRYAHALPEDTREAVRRLSQHLRRTAPERTEG